ncbi:MAG: capsule biosynthesis protein CapC [Synergistaceae bacterium]|nr:capsule biosynthesis protein CapC [Synergistaceae bacterium]
MHRTITLITGILLGLIWKRRTGWSCGGIITPGLLALYPPERIALCLLAGLLLAPVVETVSRKLDLWGTERTGCAMILAAILREVLPSGLGVGFVVPGLVACDVNRQGIAMTICGAVSCSLTTIMLTGLIS